MRINFNYGLWIVCVLYVSPCSTNELAFTIMRSVLLYALSSCYFIYELLTFDLVLSPPTGWLIFIAHCPLPRPHPHPPLPPRTERGAGPGCCHGRRGSVVGRRETCSSLVWCCCAWLLAGGTWGAFPRPSPLTSPTLSETSWQSERRGGEGVRVCVCVCVCVCVRVSQCVRVVE